MLLLRQVLRRTERSPNGRLVNRHCVCSRRRDWHERFLDSQKSQGIVPTAFNHSRLFLCFFWVSRLRHEASLVITSFALRARLGLG